MGNICRSPAAEGVLHAKLIQAGLHGTVAVDSAGTIDYHVGKLPDARMRSAASRRGLALNHRARQVTSEDLAAFDLVLVMDRENLSDVKSLDRSGRFPAKIQLFCEYCTKHDQTEVPDPYYGGDAGFETVLDLLDDGCTEIVKRIQAGKL
jgi:protein-tyrosine phosphatase